jgi:hypothetical protein
LGPVHCSHESNQVDALAAMVDADCHFKMPGMELRGSDAVKQMVRFLS